MPESALLNEVLQYNWLTQENLELLKKEATQANQDAFNQKLELLKTYNEIYTNSGGQLIDKYGLSDANVRDYGNFLAKIPTPANDKAKQFVNSLKKALAILDSSSLTKNISNDDYKKIIQIILNPKLDDVTYRKQLTSLTILLDIINKWPKDINHLDYKKIVDIIQNQKLTLTIYDNLIVLQSILSDENINENCKKNYTNEFLQNQTYQKFNFSKQINDHQRYLQLLTKEANLADSIKKVSIKNLTNSYNAFSKLENPDLSLIERKIASIEKFDQKFQEPQFNEVKKELFKWIENASDKQIANMGGLVDAFLNFVPSSALNGPDTKALLSYFLPDDSGLIKPQQEVLIFLTKLLTNKPLSDDDIKDFNAIFLAFKNNYQNTNFQYNLSTVSSLIKKDRLGLLNFSLFKILLTDKPLPKYQITSLFEEINALQHSIPPNLLQILFIKFEEALKTGEVLNFRKFLQKLSINDINLLKTQFDKIVHSLSDDKAKNEALNFLNNTPFDQPEQYKKQIPAAPDTIEATPKPPQPADTITVKPKGDGRIPLEKVTDALTADNLFFKLFEDKKYLLVSNDKEVLPFKVRYITDPKTKKQYLDVFAIEFSDKKENYDEEKIKNQITMTLEMFQKLLEEAELLDKTIEINITNGPDDATTKQREEHYKKEAARLKLKVTTKVVEPKPDSANENSFLHQNQSAPNSVKPKEQPGGGGRDLHIQPKP